MHPNFVGSLLNDLFGIQSRSGCACAGPYAQYLLGIDYELSKEIEECLVQDERIDRHHLRIRVESSTAECIRPGFTRLNFPYFMNESRIDFVLNAIEFMCQHAWRFLPQYVFNLETGEFRHRDFQVFFNFINICCKIFKLLILLILIFRFLEIENGLEISITKMEYLTIQEKS